MLLPSQQAVLWKRRSIVFTGLLAAFVALYALRAIHPILRYTVYPLPALAALAFLWLGLAHPSLKLYRAAALSYFPPLFAFYCVPILMSLIGGLARGHLPGRYFNESFLILAPIVLGTFISFYYHPDQRARWANLLLVGLILVYLLQEGPTLVTLLAGFQPSVVIAALRESSLDTENTLSLVFGPLSVYFFLSGQRRQTVVAFLMTAVSFKRVALVAAVLCFLLYWLVRRWEPRLRGKEKYVPLLAVLVNVALIIFVVRFAVGMYDDLILQIFGIGPGLLTAGRRSLFELLLSQLGTLSWWGVGIGTTGQFLRDIEFTVLVAHSDILKYYLEFGALLFPVWLYLFYQVHARSWKMIVLAVCLNLVLLTDNVMVYIQVMFVFYVLQIFLLSEAVEADPAPQPAARPG